MKVFEWASVISVSLLSEIRAHAERVYPEECCGLLLAPKEVQGQRGPSAMRLRVCRNAQDEFHRLDGARFPRTAANGYFIDPRELAAIEREKAERDEELRVIYHSHIDVPAYFSEEDTRQAMIGGEPIFPGVDYLVLSVVERNVTECKQFRFNPAHAAFEEMDPAQPGAWTWPLMPTV